MAYELTTYEGATRLVLGTRPEPCESLSDILVLEPGERRFDLAPGLFDFGVGFYFDVTRFSGQLPKLTMNVRDACRLDCQRFIDETTSPVLILMTKTESVITASVLDLTELGVDSQELWSDRSRVSVYAKFASSKRIEERVDG